MAEKKDWWMQWSGEVLPEAAMIPDGEVFFQSASARPFQSISCEQRRLLPYDNNAGAMGQAQILGKIPARLKLPFLLSRSGEPPCARNGTTKRFDEGGFISGEESK
ncbi:MAG TPA: hypothetical protein VGF67_25370 [Ktedonobacteraceae bacterium]|jgi:hypothetical protein